MSHYHPFYRENENTRGSGKAGGAAFLILLGIALAIIMAASSCTNARYACKGKDGVVYMAYAGDDVYGDTIINGKKYVVMYKNKPTPEPQQPVAPGVPMGYTVTTGYVFWHNSPFQAPHWCEKIEPLGRTTLGQIIWRTACRETYPYEQYVPY